MEVVTMIFDWIISIILIACILYWYRIGYRLNKVIAKVEKDIEHDNINRSDLDESENVFGEEK